jgi:hypothetical protein
MKANSKGSLKDLSKGQLWKANGAYILIVELGKTLIQYKMLKQERQRCVRTHMTAIANLQNYLKNQSAQLVR